MQAGRIVKAVSGFYYVQVEGQSAMIECRARGLFKISGDSPKVGDLVDFERTDPGKGWIVNIKPRITELIRPPIANVEHALLVISVKLPAINLQLLDKFLTHIEFAGLQATLCFTKLDLLADDDEQGWLALEEMTALYQAIGYPIFTLEGDVAKAQRALAKLRDDLAGKLTVIAGPSGVGKTTLLNRLFAHLDLPTGKISEKLGRGKHTTRHVELIPHPQGGYVADTPGFSQLDFSGIEIDMLAYGFKEFRTPAQHCKYRSCLHLNEPDCHVLKQVTAGVIDGKRYDHYKQFSQEIRERKRRY